MPVAEARQVMLAAINPLESEQISLSDGLGRVLAAPIMASRDQPPYAASAMDGYALRSADTPGRLHVTGESAAGRAYQGSCEQGCAIRISTGAAIPQGADSVVIQEDVSREGDWIELPTSPLGDNIRPRAGDFSSGATLLPAGRKLDGIAISMVAASGAASFAAVRKPRIAIFSSGDELAEPGTTPGHYQIFDSTTHGLASLVTTWGGTATRLNTEKDNVDAIARAAEAGLRDHDLLVVLGGASVGDHDLARPALKKLGLEFLCEKIAVRPGKPTWFGTTPLSPTLGLPGNPASALVCAHLFLKPLLEKMLGRDPQECVRSRRAHLAHTLPANGNREHYLRAHFDIDGQGRAAVRAFEDQDSSLMSVFTRANALIRLTASAPAIAKGELVDVLLLEQP